MRQTTHWTPSRRNWACMEERPRIQRRRNTRTPIHWQRHILGIVRNVVNTTSNFELSVSGACATGPFGRVGVVIPKMDQVKPDARGARKPIHCGSRNTVSGACAHVRRHEDISKVVQ